MQVKYLSFFIILIYDKQFSELFILYITVLFKKYSFYLLKSTQCEKYPVINSN